MDKHPERGVVVQPEAEGGIEWGEIKSHPRSAFWTVCLYVIGDKNFRKRAKPAQLWPRHQGFLVPALTERKTPGWRIVTPQFPNRTLSVISDRSIAPLLRLGLLDVQGDGPEMRLTISDRGMATWTLFEGRGGRWPADLI